MNVSGSTEGVENGQMATVTWGVTTKTASVLNNLWSAIFTSGEVPADGSTTITADVYDLAGNPATQQTQAVTVATGLPSITINPVTGDDKVNLAEKTDGVTISGSTDIDNGQEIIVQWGGGAHKSATVADGTWHVDYTSAEVPADGSVNITAHGSNLAGNAAIDALKSLTVDTEEPPQPLLTLGSGIAGGATSAEAAQAGGLVIVTAEDGASVSVVFAGTSGGVTKMLPGTGAAMAVALSAGELATLGDGVVNVSSVATDSAGNASITAHTSLTLDTAHPTVAVTSNASTLQAGETASITFTFSEDPGSTFDAASVAVTGGQIGEPSGTGLTRIATFTPTAASTGAATVSVANGKFADAAGNFNSDGGEANNTVAMAVDTLSSVSLMSSDWSSGFPQYGDHGVFPGL